MWFFPTSPSLYLFVSNLLSDFLFLNSLHWTNLSFCTDHSVYLGLLDWIYGSVSLQHPNVKSKVMCAWALEWRSLQNLVAVDLWIEHEINKSSLADQYSSALMQEEKRLDFSSEAEEQIITWTRWGGGSYLQEVLHSGRKQYMMRSEPKSKLQLVL